MPPLTDTSRPASVARATHLKLRSAQAAAAPPVIAQLPHLDLKDPYPQAVSTESPTVPSADENPALGTEIPGLFPVSPAATGTHAPRKAGRLPALARLDSWHDWVMKMGGTMIAAIAIIWLFRSLPSSSNPPVAELDKDWRTAAVPVAPHLTTQGATQERALTRAEDVPPPVFLDTSTPNGVGESRTADSHTEVDTLPMQPLLEWNAAADPHTPQGDASAPPLPQCLDHGGPPPAKVAHRPHGPSHDPASSPAQTDDLSEGETLGGGPPTVDYPSTGLPAPVGRFDTMDGPASRPDPVPTPAKIEGPPGGIRLGQRDATSPATLNGYIQQFTR